MTESEYLERAELPKINVFLGYPHHGQVHPWSARAFYREAVHAKHCNIMEMEADTSFVPQGYNILLHSALRTRDRYGDQGPTHFAMVHADTAPQPGWLDILWREMYTSGADAIAAVSLIKDPSYNRTSTVIGDPDNPWVPKRSVNMEDRASMPTTFGIEHVGDPATEFLQINTGCMLVDLRKPWWDIPVDGDDGDFFAFSLHQRIKRREYDPEEYARACAEEKEVARQRGHDYFPPLPYDRVTQSRSEDWEMSRHIWRHGGKCVATWAVSVDHFGQFAWNNQMRVLVKAQ